MLDKITEAGNGKGGDDKEGKSDGPYLNPAPLCNTLVDVVDGRREGGIAACGGKDERRGT